VEVDNVMIMHHQLAGFRLRLIFKEEKQVGRRLLNIDQTCLNNVDTVKKRTFSAIDQLEKYLDSIQMEDLRIIGTTLPDVTGVAALLQRVAVRDNRFNILPPP
jgi:hypothetical protein